MNGTYVYIYRTTPYGDLVLNHEIKLDGRKSQKNLMIDAEWWTRGLADHAFKIVKMKGGDFTKPIDELPLYKI